MLAGCATASGSDTATTHETADPAPQTITSEPEPPALPPSPVVPVGPLDQGTQSDVTRLLENLYTAEWDVSIINDIVDAGDPRVGWLIADLLRFYQSGPETDELVAAFTRLTGAPDLPGEVDFVWATNALMTWDLPAWDGYREAKSKVFNPIEETWRPFFEEGDGVDWRLITWGGVRADTRELDDNGACNCIPALDHPATTDATGGDWYDDERLVFGVVVNDDAIALPLHQMEVHEMLNLTLGGRELGIPYCTLCGSAQAFFTDNVPGIDQVVLRTSGLLSRSNKLMYDRTTGSAIDTFTGVALTGPLAEDDIALQQVSVVKSTWGDWKTAHPDTQILAQDGGIGRTYRDNPLGDRDANGPIFPVGEVDPRLPVQESVVGVISPDGTPIAFPVNATRSALNEGPIEYDDVTVRLEDSIRVYDQDGTELVTHESFWFAWSQFHEGTEVWTGFGG